MNLHNKVTMQVFKIRIYKRLLIGVFLTLFLLAGHFGYYKIAYSDELDDLNKQIQELQSSLTSSQNATKPLEGQLENLQKQLDNIDYQVGIIKNDIDKRKKEIEIGYENLSENQQLFNFSVRNSYINSYGFTPLIIFLSGEDAGNVTKLLAYHQRYTKRDKETITNIALQIVDLEEKKARLENEQKRLGSAMTTLDTQRAEVQKIVDGAKAYQKELKNKIATLTARQQEIINARSGGFTASIGDSNLADDPNASINGFRSSAPSGYFGVFSFGAHSHRKGMSQYGAKGRAEKGQNFRQILQAYYGKEPVDKSGDTGGNIRVAGFGEIEFETKYLYGIAEMPSSWHIEALKAQAVAARTYALRYKRDGNEICTTQSCQVYNDGKANNPPAAWKQAVDETRGLVLEDVVTYYASTHGGWTSTKGWDTEDGSGGSNFIDKAWDKIGGSPWVYKAWYTKEYNINSDKCGRSNAWLSPEEMADIVNAAIALKSGGIDTGRITPVTTSCWGGNPYSMDELRNLLGGNGISSATSVSVSLGDGRTNNVTINGKSFTGDEFCRAFNLRAPGYLQIPQWSGSSCSGAFFNIERK